VLELWDRDKILYGLCPSTRYSSYENKPKRNLWALCPQGRSEYNKMKSLDRQVAGDHYKHMSIQPAEYIMKNELSFAEGNVVKLVSRHKNKAGKADLEKAIHWLEILIEHEYPEEG
jgi:hypothetical protein